MRRFNLIDELRETADRRKKFDDPSSSLLRGESVQQISARLAVMFPELPGDTVEAVLSQLFRADAKITREILADRAVSALVEMSFVDGSPQAITSFEARSIVGCEIESSSAAYLQPRVGIADDGFTNVTPSAPTSIEVTEVGFTQDDCTSIENIMPPTVDGNDAFDDILDSHLALLLSLSDDVLLPCVQTLNSILQRIVDDPVNARVRRLRHGNKAFASKVGCHEAAIELLRLAGFEEDPGDGNDDSGMVFCGDPSDSFARVRSSLEDLLEGLTEKEQPQHGSLKNNITRATGDSRRDRTAALTEERLKNPAKFKEQALARGAANKAIGGKLPKRVGPATQDVSNRKSRHFNLSDIERMRVADEIAGTTNYAEEYQRTRHSSPVHDYGTLVSRSYDPELISRQALDGTNRYRASKGRPPLRWNAGIAAIAAEHAASMASGAAPFSHDGFEARVSRFPVAQRGAGENLALNSGVSTVAQTAVDGWIKSPGHEKNLVGNFNVCGIGTAQSSNGTFYLTQLFALCV